MLKPQESVVYNLRQVRELKKLVSQGEGLYLEFKRKASYPDKIVREMIALANTKGGSVLIGVGDDGSIPGLKYPEDESHVILQALKSCKPAMAWKENFIPLGKSRKVLEAEIQRIDTGTSAVIVTYGMGVYWAKEASKDFSGQIEIIDLRTLNPIDWDAITESVKKHGRAFVLTEEPLLNSFAESLAGRISKECFSRLDAPVWTLGASNLPAVPLNVDLEKMMLPNAEKVTASLRDLLDF